VQEATAPAIAAWESFYVIVGSSAAALTGLMFVVITLIRDVRAPSSPQTLAAFGSPTVVHFCLALLVSAILSAPWRELASAALALGAVGIGALIYEMIVLRRTRSQTGYTPVLEDWLWHVVFPFAAYTMITVAAFELVRHPTPALFAVAAATVLLVFTGIHNAWDTVTYVTVDLPRQQQQQQQQQQRSVDEAAAVAPLSSGESGA